MTNMAGEFIHLRLNTLGRRPLLTIWFVLARMLQQKEIDMRNLLLAAAISLPLAASLPTPGSARGCIKGAAIGGVAGHVAGHHAVAGAAVGCVIGHHRAKVKEREAAQVAARAHQSTAPSGSAPAVH
jgi:hypothetical protein